MRSCNACYYWHKLEPHPSVQYTVYGECRKALPKLREESNGYAWRGIWPQTAEDEWCGRFIDADIYKRAIQEGLHG